MVNLKGLKKGDILISKHGAILEYLEELPEEDYMDVRVKYLYLNGSLNKGEFGEGTRSFEGDTYRRAKLDNDHDIIAAISREDLLTILGVV